MNKLKCLNLFFIISIILWSAITLIRVVNHSPWYDEAHAWTIARDLNLIEVIKYMKIEGHTFIWYLLLMPFAKTNFMYPYSMLLLNWLFCFIAVLILWLKAPFNNWIKFLISFSFPFLSLYPVVARCYAIGIMFLFGITAMENKKLEHPNWYALLLILCANTSIIAAVGSAVFGLTFIYEMLKNKKKILVPFLLMFIGLFIFLFQLIFCLVDNAVVSTVEKTMTFKNIIFSKESLTYTLALLLTLFYYAKNKMLPNFLLGTNILLVVIFSIYNGRIWHWFFFYIYFVISNWLFNEKYKKSKIYLYTLSILSVMLIFWSPSKADIVNVWNCDTGVVAQKILKDENLNNSILLVVEPSISVIQNYLHLNSSITVFNYCSGQRANYDDVYFYRSNVCEYGKIHKIIFNDDLLSRFYSNSTYLLVSKNIKIPKEGKMGGMEYYKFIFYKSFGQIDIFKLEKI